MMETLLSIFSPRKRASEPPKPLPHPRARTYSKNDRARARRALGRISDSGTRSPRNRTSNASSITPAHDTSGEISYPSQPEEQDATAEMDTPNSETGSPARRDDTRSPSLGSSPAPKPRGKTRAAPQQAEQRPPKRARQAKPTRPEYWDDETPEVEDEAQHGSDEKDAKGKERQEEEEEPEEEDDQEPYSFSKILNHRWSRNKIELQIDWENHPRSWEPEENFHRDAPAALFAYWRLQGGRPDNPQNPGVYDIFAIRKHSKNKRKVLVEWVGYEKSEQTWEDRKTIEKAAKDLVNDYFDGLKKH